MPTFPSSSCHSNGEETEQTSVYIFSGLARDPEEADGNATQTDILHQVERSHNDYPRSFGQHLIEKPAGASSLNDSCYSNKSFRKLTKTKWLQAAQLLQDSREDHILISHPRWFSTVWQSIVPNLPWSNASFQTELPRVLAVGKTVLAMYTFCPNPIADVKLMVNTISQIYQKLLA